MAAAETFHLNKEVLVGIDIKELHSALVTNVERENCDKT
jgi:hypothetical protein